MYLLAVITDPGMMPASKVERDVFLELGVEWASPKLLLRHL